VNENDATNLVAALFDRWYPSILTMKRCLSTSTGEMSSARIRPIRNHLKAAGNIDLCWRIWSRKLKRFHACCRRNGILIPIGLSERGKDFFDGGHHLRDGESRF
jgi:hypothetical protein